MDNREATELLETARRAAQAGGRLLRKKLQEPRELTRKGFRDWVTDADFAIQAKIADIVQKRHPAHGFLAEEELAHLPSSGDVLWIVDPIDGTTNFSRQQPNFCISIGVARAEHIEAGVIFDPLRDELFAAARGTTTTLNHQPVHVSNTPWVSRSVVAFDWAHSEQDRQATLDSLQYLAHTVRSLRSIGSAALALAWVACGRLDAYWNWHLNAWDVAAGALLIEQAGGRCTDLQQRPYKVSRSAGPCLASNGVLHDNLARLIARERRSSP